MNRFVFTCGDTNGIGPEIVIKTLNRVAKNSRDNFSFICPENIFADAAKIITPKFQYEITDRFSSSPRNVVSVISQGKFKKLTGKPTEDSGEAAFKSIELSGKLAVSKQVDAVITAPISKTAIKIAGHNFPGHTEMYAKWSGVKYFVMMFLSAKMNAALATIHEPINKVPSLLTGISLEKNIEIILNTLKIDLQIKQPKIAVLGLNPHAGEGGLIGTEELNIIKPVISSKGFKKYLNGPYSPDAFFANNLYKNYDLVLGMYHDQVLIPFKMINFGAGVNYTAGLPIVRTSPDHGTAFDIAWKNLASESSMLQAFYYAKQIVRNRNKFYAA